MERDIKKLISEMTLEEKAGLCSGLDFWHTKGIERLGIPSIMVTDGPHGLRKQDASSDHLGINDSVPSTCFPSGAGLACSWDRELIKKVGVALGEECQAENVAIILGPAVNIKRSPLCGRNFEYFSEDPYLASELAAEHISGVQSQGVGTSLKHFAANNQETRRMSVDAIVDERVLREIYLASFEGAVKKSQPWTVMCSYNKINGEYASENHYLLTEILKKEWGHSGYVVSDWGAVNERAKGLFAGLELEMPSSNGEGDRKIVEAVKAGSLEEGVLDEAVERLLKITFKAIDHKKINYTYDKEQHHELAREVAKECIVLLKNEDKLLPLKKGIKLAVIGGFAKNPRYQGGGSSHINPTRLENAYDEIVKLNGIDTTYVEGYVLENDIVDQLYIDNAIDVAKRSEAAIIFAGLTDKYESEGYDREHIRIPENHRKLIEEVSKVQENVVVVLSNGSPIEMPWLSGVPAVIDGYLGGQATGGAIASVLFGETNPCGKLAETFPMKLEHNPSYINFPGEEDKVEYKEGLFVGYRYYDVKCIKPLFPFGHGLSYTSYEYSDLILDKKELTDLETLKVSVKVKNTGVMAGKEIVQLYVRDKQSTVIRPLKELKGFEKVELKPGQQKTVVFTLDKRAFAYYNTSISDWHVETGEFDILIGKSSDEIVLCGTVKLNSTVVIKKKFHRNSTIGDVMSDPIGAIMAKQLMESMASSDGGLMNLLKDADDMLMAMIKYMPIRALISFSQGKLTEEMVEGMLKQLNQ